MKTQLNRRTRIPLLGILIVLAGSLFLSQCKDDEVTALDSQDVTGMYAINTTDGSWGLDKSHSSVNWKAFYYGDQAFLTGKFNSFGVTVDFDQSDLANSEIGGWVKLSACNTGEPGRDGLGHCLNGYLGVEHNGDTLPDGELDPAGIIGSTDTATFESDDIVAYGDGYKANGTMDFRGESHPITLYFTYITEKDYSNPPDGSRIRASLVGYFEFNAITDYGVNSTSIGDKIHVDIQAIMRKF